MLIFAHRGLDLDRSSPPHENSLAAFELAAERGWSIELDVQMEKKGELLIAHDSHMSRWTRGQDPRGWREVDRAETAEMEARLGRLGRLSDVLELCRRYGGLHVALHLKGSNHDEEFIAQLMKELRAWKSLQSRLLVFDLSPHIAQTLRDEFSDIGLALSVADEFDVSRYQAVTGGTLYTVDQALAARSCCDWVWLDEWNRKGPCETRKALYSEDRVSALRDAGYKIAIVSPELHRLEGHEDAVSDNLLEARWREICQWRCDAICTDYPARIAQLARELPGPTGLVSN
ncbi:MAG: glycerophosphodiester phosphodiesterase [Bdellovibrionales bacterium]